jgi:hypothetical protein
VALLLIVGIAFWGGIWYRNRRQQRAPPNDWQAPVDGGIQEILLVKEEVAEMDNTAGFSHELPIQATELAVTPESPSQRRVVELEG